MAERAPIKPKPAPVNLDSKSTAVVVLDVGTEPREWLSANEESKYLGELKAFLDKARGSAVPVIYTLSARLKGTQKDGVAAGLNRKETEPIFYPDAYDKLAGGEVQNVLSKNGIKNVILVGSGANIAVLYTATTAARVYRYNVIIPVDGVIVRGRYEREYAFHHLCILPANTSKLIRFTTLSDITFG